MSMKLSSAVLLMKKPIALVGIKNFDRNWTVKMNVEWADHLRIILSIMLNIPKPNM